MTRRRPGIGLASDREKSPQKGKVSLNPTAKRMGRKGVLQGWHDIAGASFRVVFEATGLELPIVGASG